MVSTWPRMVMKVPRGRDLRWASTMRCTSPLTAPRSRSCDVAVDIDHAADVVVVDDGHLASALASKRHPQESPDCRWAPPAMGIFWMSLID